jgi:hypothetical protein
MNNMFMWRMFATQGITFLARSLNTVNANQYTEQRRVNTDLREIRLAASAALPAITRRGFDEVVIPSCQLKWWRNFLHSRCNVVHKSHGSLVYVTEVRVGSALGCRSYRKHAGALIELGFQAPSSSCHALLIIMELPTILFLRWAYIRPEFNFLAEANIFRSPQRPDWLWGLPSPLGALPIGIKHPAWSWL